MKDFVGVMSNPWPLLERSLKREALLFNKLAIVGCESYIANLDESDLVESDTAAEIEWLFNNGIIFEPAKNFGTDLWRRIIKEHRREGSFELLRKASKQKLSELLKDEIDEVIRKEGITPTEDMMEILDLYNEVYFHTEYLLRPISLCLREPNKMDAYPVFGFDLANLQQSTAEKSDIIQIVLNALPMPDESVSWEQVIDYHSDPDTMSKFFALRNWMNETARAKLSPLEVEQKLEYLIDRYQQHLKLHRMKTNTGTLETVVVTGAEFVENLVKVNWGKIAKGLFSLRHRRISLLEGELNAPGNEIAYIVKAREAFS